MNPLQKHSYVLSVLICVVCSRSLWFLRVFMCRKHGSSDCVCVCVCVMKDLERGRLADSCAKSCNILSLPCYFREFTWVTISLVYRVHIMFIFLTSNLHFFFTLVLTLRNNSSWPIIFFSVIADGRCFVSSLFWIVVFNVHVFFL